MIVQKNRCQYSPKYSWYVPGSRCRRTQNTWSTRPTGSLDNLHHQLLAVYLRVNLSLLYLSVNKTGGYVTATIQDLLSIRKYSVRLDVIIVIWERLILSLLSSLLFYIDFKVYQYTRYR